MFHRIFELTSLCLMPVGLAWVLTVAGAVFLLVRRKLKLAAFLGCLAASFSILGGTPLPNALLRTLEKPYRAQEIDRLPKADAVIMLGGVLFNSPDRFGFNFTSMSDRVILALELIRQGKAPALVL